MGRLRQVGKRANTTRELRLGSELQLLGSGHPWFTVVQRSFSSISTIAPPDSRLNTELPPSVKRARGGSCQKTSIEFPDCGAAGSKASSICQPSSADNRVILRRATPVGRVSSPWTLKASRVFHRGFSWWADQRNAPRRSGNARFAGWGPLCAAQEER